MKTIDPTPPYTFPFDRTHTVRQISNLPSFWQVGNLPHIWPVGNLSHVARLVLPLLWLCLAAGLARAQGPQLGRMISSREVQFGIVDGRLTFRDANAGTRVPTSKEESLRTSLEDGQSRLDYDWLGKTDSLTVEISGHRQFAHLADEPLGKASFPRVEYTQASDEKVALIIGTGEKTQVFRAADLWQLALAHPRECQQHLTPLLLKLRPGRSLTDTCTRIEAKLLTMPGDEMTARRLRWAKLVVELGDDRFGKRQAADRALRGEGSAVVGYLRRLDYRRLDAEQQFRIGRTLEALAGHDDDSIETAVATLAEEPRVWLILLVRAEQPVRQAASHHLASLLGRRIDVDPAAAPETQKENLERLRARIEARIRD